MSENKLFLLTSITHVQDSTHVVADVRVISLPKNHSSKSRRTTRQCPPTRTTSAVITNFQLTRTSPCCRHLLSLPLSSFQPYPAPHALSKTDSSSKSRLACLHRVPRRCTSSARLASVLLKIRTVLAEIGLITWLSIGAVGKLLRRSVVGYALQPARVLFSLPSLLFLCAKTHHALSHKSVVAGRVLCAEVSAS